MGQSLSPQEIRLALFDYIEGFYNTHRIHSALNGHSPPGVRPKGPRDGFWWVIHTSISDEF